MAYTRHYWVNGADGNTPISDIRLNEMEEGIETAHVLNSAGTAGDFGAVLLDAFSGANADAKLTAALSAVASETYPRTIQLTNQEYAFSTGNRVAFEGMRIAGPPGISTPERSGTKMGSRITLSMNGPWFHNNGIDVFSATFRNLSFVGTGTNATVLGQAGSGGWSNLSMSGIYASALRSVLGTQATKVSITGASFTGDWEVNNCYNGAFHLGGTSNVLWSDGMLLDSGTSFNSTGGAAGQFHIWCDGLDKSYIGPVNVIAEGNWGAIRVTGSAFNSTSASQGGPVTFNGLRIEGRSPTAPCNGSLVRVEGGIVELNSCWLGYAMSSPTSMGHSPADAGVVHHSGGQLDVAGCTYDRASSVAETVPFVYTASNADCIINRTKRAARGGTWTGRPRFARLTANAENRINDTTVTQTLA